MPITDTNRELLEARVRVIIDGLGKDVDFVTALEKIYATPDLLTPELQKNKQRLSSGVSDVQAYAPYLAVASSSIATHAHYRNYPAPQGDYTARAALAIMESSKFENNFNYEADDICITEGATGAISSLFEYISKQYSQAEVVIPCPSYYAFRLCANQFGLSCIEVSPATDGTRPMVPMDKIINAITQQTKVIALTQPTNPTGEIYTPEDIQRLLRIAAERNILILFDELFADLIMDETAQYTPCDVIAEREGLLKQAVFVKAYSKSRNMPGFRIGYLLARNPELIRGLVKAQEHRAFGASGSNFKGVIILDAFNQTVDNCVRVHGLSVTAAVQAACNTFRTAHITIPYEEASLQHEYEGFREYMRGTIHRYENNLQVITATLKGAIDYMPDTKTAFNTFIRMRSLDHVNQFDFCLNLFLFFGVKTQVGPYYGYTQQLWESELGFWLRVTYSLDPKLLAEASEKFMIFRQDYLQHPHKYIHLNREFK